MIEDSRTEAPEPTEVVACRYCGRHCEELTDVGRHAVLVCSRALLKKGSRPLSVDQVLVCPRGQCQAKYDLDRGANQSSPKRLPEQTEVPF